MVASGLDDVGFAGARGMGSARLVVETLENEDKRKSRQWGGKVAEGK